MDLNDLPDPATLGVESLRQLLTLFQDTATTAARAGDMALANWARTIADCYAARLNENARHRRELQRAITDSRRRRPHGTPGDVTGIPPWSQASGEDT
ncbi:hypothetical protein B8W69_26970 [Mycobacterium vulneris]|uniref:Uncharacterized protein n=1 Tax=Mycolicibacterium vulneris TaxID=547163 RepID=A0A1X2KK24_9MYCO|nr:hypothetical protein [Mycolicibacterium vulneris]OSC22098.1 hypothetical protein B8W69_26970 [Mycolicibacterium vulneris]